MEYETILDALKENRIFEIERIDGGFEITEGCDQYFRVRLTPEQLKALGEELMALAHTPNEKS